MIDIKNNAFRPETVALGTEFASPSQFAGVVESDIIRSYTVSENIGYNSVYKSTNGLRNSPSPSRLPTAYEDYYTE